MVYQAELVMWAPTVNWDDSDDSEDSDLEDSHIDLGKSRMDSG